MIYAYSRISTEKQAVDGQEHRLKECYPGAEWHQETASGMKQRKVLEALILKLQAGDTLVVVALDRLGRRTAEILTLIETLHKRGVNVVSLREGLDYSTPTGKLVTQVMIAVSELERNLISQRTKDALAAKKAAGVKLGRPTKYGEPARIEARRLRAEGRKYREISRLTGISMGCLRDALDAA